MRLWPFGRQQRKAAPGYASAVSRRTWQSEFAGLFNAYVPLTVDYALYDGIREAIPFVDAALRKLARLCGGFSVTCDNQRTEAAAAQFMADMTFCDIVRGWDTFGYVYVSSLVQYGKAAAEIVLAEDLRSVSQVVPIAASRVQLFEQDGRLQLGEYQNGVRVVYPRQDLFCYSALNMEGDNPHGVSMLRSLPFVANATLVMQNAIRQNWQRQGAPAFLVVDKLSPDLNIGAAEMSARNATVKAEWNAAMKDRWEQQGIADFILGTQGDFTVQAIESSSGLEFANTLRALQEQIVSTLELAPFMLGLQWSTTERLSQQQADMIIATIDAIRLEIEPAYMLVLNWWARSQGIRDELVPQWASVSLQDVVETARADLFAAQAQKQRIANGLAAWQNGFIDQQGAMEMAGIEGEPVEHLEQPVVSQPGQQAVERARELWRHYPA